MKKYFIPEYQNDIDKVFLVSPIEVREEMWNNFHFFLKTLIDIIKKKNKDQKVVIICNSENAKNKTIELLDITNRNDANTLEFFVLGISDVWVRDYFSCGNVVDDCIFGNVKAIYAPSYNELAAVDDAAGVALSRKYFENTVQVPFKLEGGNVICNSKYVFISEKLYTENFYLDKPTIDKFFEDNFKQKLVTLPTEVLDVVGHTDCILRFLDEKTILMPIYEADFKVDNRYIMNVKKIIAEKTGVDYNIIFLPSYLSDEINEDNIFSAKGLYLNFFRFEDYIIFPSFENLKDYEIEIERILHKLAPEIKVCFSPCDQIAFEGGCFSCITNVKYRL